MSDSTVSGVDAVGAAKTGDVDTVKAWVEAEKQGARDFLRAGIGKRGDYPEDLLDEFGKTLLEIATSYGRMNVVQYIISEKEKRDK